MPYPQRLLAQYPLPTQHPKRTAKSDAKYLGDRAFWSNRKCPAHFIDVLGFPMTLRYTRNSGCYLCAEQRSDEQHAKNLRRKSDARAQLLASYGLLPSAPSSRREAVARGEAMYFNAQKCAIQHIAPRFAASGQCYECIKYLQGRVVWTKRGGKYLKIFNNVPMDSPEQHEIVVDNMQTLLQTLPDSAYD